MDEACSESAQGNALESIVGAVSSAIRQSLSGRLLSVNPPNAPARTPPSAFERACDLRPKRPKFMPPSLFESNRNRKRGRKSKSDAPKVVSYVRDIVLLPKQFEKKGEISIPRATKRSRLGMAGLVGKIDINSDMSDFDVGKEICEIFSTPMGLSKEDIEA